MAAIAMTITNGYLNLLAGAPIGWQSDRILYFAVGTGNSTPAATNTLLDAEVYRNIFKTFAAGANNELHMYGFIDLAYANVAIAEVGLFGSSSTNAATTSPNTGVLLARGLWSHSKASGETITLDFDMFFT